MTTLAQVQTAAVNVESQMDSLTNTALGGATPDGARCRAIVALIQDTKTKFHNLMTDAVAQAQALGVG